MRIAGSVTRIRKFEPSTQPPPSQLDEDADDDSDDYDITDVGKGKKSRVAEVEGDEVQELPETSDEIARIYWKWFSSNRIIFRGKITNREEFLPKCGKLKG